MAKDDQGGQDSSHSILTMMQTFMLRQDAQAKDDHEQALKMAEIQRQVQEGIREIQRVSTVIRGVGNGKEGLAPRLDRLEEKMSGVASVLDEFRSVFDVRATAAESGKWDFAKGLLIALISAAALLMAAILTGLLKKGG